MGIVEEILKDVERKDLSFRLESFRRGDFVRSAGEDFSDLMILEKGVLKVESVGKSGRVLELDRINAPELVFPCITLSDSPVLDVDLIAVSDVRIVLIDRDRFFDYLWKKRDRAVAFFSYLGRQFSRIVRRLSGVILSDLREKIASYLLTLYEEQGSLKVTVPHTREELARMFGATRPSVSRIFSEFSSEGYISLKRSEVEILDLEGLREVAEGGAL